MSEGARYHCIQRLATEILATGDFTVQGPIGVTQEGRWDNASAVPVGVQTLSLYSAIFGVYTFGPVCGLMVGRWLLHLQASHLHSRPERGGEVRHKALPSVALLLHLGRNTSLRDFCP